MVKSKIFSVDWKNLFNFCKIIFLLFLNNHKLFFKLEHI
jgi:hypothetical protein